MTLFSNHAIDFSCREIVDLRRVAARVDRAAHQDKCGGLAILVARRHHRRGDERRYGRLTDGHHMRVRADEANEIDEIVDEVVEVEASGGEWHVAGVGPIRNVNVMLRQHGLDGAAQQRRVMARHRCDDQNLGVVALSAFGLVAAEMNEVAEGF